MGTDLRLEGHPPRWTRLERLYRWRAWLGFVLAFSLRAEPSPFHDAATQAASTYHQRRVEWMQAPTNQAAGWKFGRAAFDWAEATTNPSVKAAIAQNGISACRQVLEIGPSAPARYYLALNLGKLAETRGFSALGLTREMEAELLKVKKEDEQFDHAGADRSLGLLYREAPGWPISLGSGSKARFHLEEAVRIDGTFPENRIALAEFYLQEHRNALLKEQLRALDSLWAAAHVQLSGKEWEMAWRDWEERRKRLPSPP